MKSIEVKLVGQVRTTEKTRKPELRPPADLVSSQEAGGLTPPSLRPDLCGD
jgi:hypothetical protein